jgi:hypothetical protein
MDVQNHHHTPTKFQERGLMQFVTRGVTIDFCQPPFAPVRRCRAVPAAAMPMR